MPNKSTDALFQLIHSLEKSEKRNFKLYIKRNSSKGDLKIITLFDAIDKQNSYDEDAILGKNPSIKKQQLPNLKAHLYRQILISLMLLRNSTTNEFQFYEQLEFARTLYEKGLFHQSLRILDRIKDAAKTTHQIPLLITVLEEEKRIEYLHITRSSTDRATVLASEVEDAISHYNRQARLSSLVLQLYEWYIKNGIASNAKAEKEISSFFKDNLTADLRHPKGFYEKLYYFQAHCWYAYIRQDFLMYYRYCKKWTEVFAEYPEMLCIETENYLKGMHNLLNAHFNLRNFEGFKKSLEEFEKFALAPEANRDENTRIQTFVYLYTARINKHFLEGSFEEGIKLVPEIVEQLDKYELILDKHRTLVFYYKIASLYFGAGNYGKAIDYLNKIINWKVNLRNDLQCYARLLHLIAHYELDNFSLMEYLIKSVYRFMAKMENLSKVEEAMFGFLRRSFHISKREIKPEFVRLLDELKTMESGKFETRAFAYLDIISWLESKIYNKPVAGIIRKKYIEKKRFDKVSAKSPKQS
ncbi:MAG: hypothetical protein J5I50_11695 [Chitinophagaceae bacterium]|nr:hypothetical protein [Chitinophagaceae bacterium]